MIEAKNTIISIGLPVFNGEKFLREKIESILDQTFQDFELIISDNASTDKTKEICQEFLEKDQRIQYFRQEKNIGSVKNFEFVLEKAKFEYYIATAVDDQISNNYLESNLEMIRKNENCIGSVGKTNLFGTAMEEMKVKQNDPFRIKINKKIRQWLASFFIESFQGKYYEKIRMSLKWTGATMVMYGVFRTDVFRKSFPKERIFGLESIFVINLIKYGDIILNENTCVKKFVGKGATSASGMSHLLKNYETNIFTKIFPLSPFTMWMLKNHGIKLFIKNLDALIELNLKMELFVIYDIFKKLKRTT